jgi:Carboxypeptidase regulatory-like domain
MRKRTHISVASLLVALACLGAPERVCGAASVNLSGSITGLVTNEVGIPQMGAAVMLFNRHERLFQRVLTDEKGIFAFSGLLPDVYSIRVTLASFVPAIKKDILVQPGVRALLSVNMATLFSSIHFVYPGDNPSLMNDDWKWVLRTADGTRPVMRLLPDGQPQVTLEAPPPQKPVFSDTRAILVFSAGDGAPVSGFGSTADMGTSFALATSLFGSNQIQFAGNLGSGAQSGMPSAAFRTTYSRSMGPDTPVVSVTVRELFFPGRAGTAMFGADNGAPMFRSVSTSVDNHTRISDALSVDYGSGVDSISFLDHLTYVSPYARFTYTLDANSELAFGFSSGNPPPDLSGAGNETNTELQRDVGALSLFPLISLLGGHTAVQRSQNLDLRYSRAIGSRKFSLGVYHDAIENLALTIASPNGFLPGGDVLPDVFSGTSIFNAGNFSSTGLLASVTQKLGGNVSATATYGSLGALTAEPGQLATNNPDELRSMIRGGREQTLTARVTATSPLTGTHFTVSYQWADSRWAEPGYSSNIDSLRPQPGLNIYIRQPIPKLPLLPWRMEATADLRNMLAQGYLPISSTDGSQLILMETPRMVRGGLNFIF